MKLIELNPRWIGAGGEGIFDENHNPVPYREKVGVVFDCPVCGKEHPCFIPFTNPPDGKPPVKQRVTWELNGDSFETMSITPSIQRMDKCNWHGFITNGEVINA